MIDHEMTNDASATARKSEDLDESGLENLGGEPVGHEPSTPFATTNDSQTAQTSPVGESIATNEPGLTEDKKSEDDQSVTGFGPLRMWMNQRIRRADGRVVLQYADNYHSVTEITPDGQIRLQRGEAFNLVPLDERFIQKLFGQLL